MSELKLLPCPFCGGHIILPERHETVDEAYTETICTGCCMHFSYTEYFTYSCVARVRHNNSFAEVWNHRVGGNEND